MKSDVDQEERFLFDCLQDKLNFRKVILTGCKMKVYQERLSTGYFLKALQQFKNDQGEYICENLKDHLEQC